MPYIQQSQRKEIQASLDTLVETLLAAESRDRAGLLNYIIAVLANAWFSADRRYDTANSIAGALECSKLEIYRRLVVNYEEFKANSNGDVFATPPAGEWIAEIVTNAMTEVGLTGKAV